MRYFSGIHQGQQVREVSIFIRHQSMLFYNSGEDADQSLLSEDQEYAPRSLNSDISYFGVGGKQAIFFIGNSTRV